MGEAMVIENEREMTAELERVCDNVRQNEAMSKHTTIGAGGPARFFAIPGSPAQLIDLVRVAREHGLDYIGVGRGSNLLVRDGGYNGLIIRAATNLSRIRVYKKTIYAESGVSFTRVGRIAHKNGRPGFEFAIGIPGSVGGAVRMNAGAYGSELANVLKSVKIINEDGQVVVLTPEDLAFRYRQSALPARAIVLSATFNSPPGELDEAQLQRSLSRKNSQPLAQRSFGSTFRNPPGAFAAELIEKCGLKGAKRGGVMVSEKHANFVVNTGSDTKANDVEDLIKDVMDRVYERFDVRLKPEVIIIGNR